MYASARTHSTCGMQPARLPVMTSKSMQYALMNAMALAAAMLRVAPPWPRMPMCVAVDRATSRSSSPAGCSHMHRLRSAWCPTWAELFLRSRMSVRACVEVPEVCLCLLSPLQWGWGDSAMVAMCVHGATCMAQSHRCGSDVHHLRRLLHPMQSQEGPLLPTCMHARCGSWVAQA